MLLNLLGLAALIFLAYVFFTLFLRALHARRPAVRIVGGFFGGVLTLAAIAAVSAALYGLWQTNVPRAQPAPAIKVAATTELIARGQALAQPCVQCHSYDGSPVLNGGATNWAASAGPYGHVYPPNLTPGGELQGWTDGEIVRAIRHGFDNAGLPLLGHPRGADAGMSDADAGALVAYLRSQPALRHDQPPRSLNLLGLWAVAAGLVQ